MTIRASDILALADELRGHALRCGHDLNSAHLFAHRFLLRSLAAGDDLPSITEELHVLAHRMESEAPRAGARAA